MEKTKGPKIDMTLAVPTLAVTIVVALCLIIAPDRSANVINTLLSFLTNQFGWLFEVAGLGALLFCLWLSFSRYGRIKLGGREEKPAHSTITWFAMLFCTGIGTTLFYWSVAEPLSYLMGPPNGVIPGSELNQAAAGEFALSYGFFHWGFTAWALYIIPTIAIAYSVYVRKQSAFRFSIACQGVLKEHSKGILGKIIDVLALFGIFGATMASIGTGVPLLAELVHGLFGWENNFAMTVGIIIVWLALFGTSVYLGLEKGIARLSDINLVISYGLLLIVLLAGPTMYILNLGTNSIGLMFDNFLRMSLWTDPIAAGGFPQGWTTFYFAWWLAFGPVMGLFVAKVSRGRTIKQVVLGELLAGTMGCWLYFFVFGGYGISLEFSGKLALLEIFATSGGNTAIVEVLKTLPLPGLILILAILNGFIFSGTSYDSAAYTLAFSTLKVQEGKSGNQEEPARWWRLVWAGMLAFGALGLLMVGGLSSLQTACVVVGLPLIFVFVIMTISFLKWAKEDFGAVSDKEILVIETKEE
ncbi:MAG: BCCT family transporter [Lachnospiraceae bacterium]